MIRHLSLRRRLFLYGSDCLLVIGAMALANWLRVALDVGASAPDEVFATPPFLFAISGALWWLALQLAGVYYPRYMASFWRESQRVVMGHVLACLLFFGTLYITYRDYSRLQAAYFVTLALAAILAHRATLRLTSALLGKDFRRPRTVLVIGSDENARSVGETVGLYAWTGLRLLGFVKQRPTDSVAEDLNGPILGALDRLGKILEQQQVDEVIIALRWPDYDTLSRVMFVLQSHIVNIRLAPDFSELAYFHVSTEDFGGMPLIGLREACLSPSQRLVKRALDVTLAGAVLALGWPLFLITALAIRLDSPGPAFLTQPRVGQFGRVFKMVKFRTMFQGENRPPRPLADKSPDDPRITQIGRFLRRTSLDELPQFLNILRGEMSLVGPRPELPERVDQYERWQRKRFEVPQGLTGWWQVNGRAENPMHLHTEDDLFYIRHYSLWLDLQIIARTIIAVIQGRGAY